MYNFWPVLLSFMNFRGSEVRIIHGYDEERMTDIWSRIHKLWKQERKNVSKIGRCLVLGIRRML